MSGRPNTTFTWPETTKNADLSNILGAAVVCSPKIETLQIVSVKKRVKTSEMLMYLRHDDDSEVQPVPRISHKGERHHTESSRKYLYNGLECVNSSKSVSEKYSQGKMHQFLNSACKNLVKIAKSKYMIHQIVKDMQQHA